MEAYDKAVLKHCKSKKIKRSTQLYTYDMKPSTHYSNLENKSSMQKVSYVDYKKQMSTSTEQLASVISNSFTGVYINPTRRNSGSSDGSIWENIGYQFLTDSDSSSEYDTASERSFDSVPGEVLVEQEILRSNVEQLESMLDRGTITMDQFIQSMRENRDALYEEVEIAVDDNLQPVAVREALRPGLRPIENTTTPVSTTTQRRRYHTIQDNQNGTEHTQQRSHQPIHSRM